MSCGLPDQMAEGRPDSKTRATDEQMVTENSINLTPRPKLTSVKQNEESKWPLRVDPPQTEQERRQRCQARQRYIRVNKVRRMYSLGVSNEATMRRIMEKHGGTLDRWLDESDTNDLISISAVEGTDHEGKKKPTGTVERHLQAVGTRPTLEEAFNTNEETVHITQARGGPFSCKVDSSNSDLTPKTLTERMDLKDDAEARQPCCFADVLNTHKVIEPRCVSLLWQNYVE